MTPGQVANGVASALVTIASLGFILIYAASTGWSRSSIGRFMMLKAVGICLTGVITISLTLVDFQSNADPLRFFQSALWTIIAVAYAHHIWLVWKVQKKGDRLDD